MFLSIMRRCLKALKTTMHSLVYCLVRCFAGADPGFGVRGGKIQQGDLRVLLLLSQMFMERMMQEN